MARDLRKVLAGLLRSWGHDVLLQRRVLNAQSGIYALADNNGFATKLERWTVRHTLKRETMLPSSMQANMEGLAIKVDLIYYFTWEAAPKEGDRIYEPDQRYDPTLTDSQSSYTTYIIDYAVPMRGIGGRVEFWVVGCSRETPK